MYHNAGERPEEEVEALQREQRREPAGRHDTGSISVVVPVFNSASRLASLVGRLSVSLNQVGAPYEIILVNDGGQDASWERIVDLSVEYQRLRGINLMRNYGQHNALLAGIRAAQYDIIVTLDDNLQHPPEEIAKLLEKLSVGFDVVYGTPQKEKHGLWRKMASWLTKLAMQSAMGAETARSISAFRAFRTTLRDAFVTYQSPFVSIDVLLTWGTSRFASVPVRHDSRQEDESNYTFRKLVTHALNMMTGFSTLPLQLASLVGFTFTLFGLAVLLYVLGRFVVQGGSVPGFPFIASTIAIFSGAQLFALGIIGEYLARMHFRTMNRPAYAVRECTGMSDERIRNDREI
jgi:undecaprenyl-phosphate 4-deoxy-4-formamido-L-arabinose transferase